MAPPRKHYDNEEDRIKAEKRRAKYRRAYQRKRLSILAKNKACHERNKERYNASKAEKQKLVRQEIKVAKGRYEVVEACITPTIEAVCGHFSGDGCVLSDTKTLGVFSMDLETLKCYEYFFGGHTRKQGNGYYWRTRQPTFTKACEELAKFAWTKQKQLLLAMSAERKNDVLKEMKNQDLVDKEQVLTLDPAIIDKVVAGFFTADGHCTNRHAKLSAYVVFGQKFPKILEIIAENYNGASVIKPYNPTANGNKIDKHGKAYIAYQLTFSGENALALLKRIEPWIISERVKKNVLRTIQLHEQNH